MREKNEYWKTRARILRAIENKDDTALKAFSTSHPEIFNQLVSQAKNAMYKTERKGWRTR